MNEAQLRNYILAGNGKTPVDLLITNAKLVNVFTGEIEETEMARLLPVITLTFCL